MLEEEEEEEAASEGGMPRARAAVGRAGDGTSSLLSIMKASEAVPPPNGPPTSDAVAPGPRTSFLALRCWFCSLHMRTLCGLRVGLPPPGSLAPSWSNVPPSLARLSSKRPEPFLPTSFLLLYFWRRGPPAAAEPRRSAIEDETDARFEQCSESTERAEPAEVRHDARVTVLDGRMTEREHTLRLI